MRLAPWGLAAAAIVAAAPARAQEAALSLDTTAIQAGQSVGLDLVVVLPSRGGSMSRLPQIPAPPGVELRFRGQGQRMENVNGHVVRQQVLQYVVKAPREGSWPIGPVEIDLGGHTVKSNQVTLTVGPRAPEQARPKGVEATAALDPDEAWLGQVVVYRFQVRSPEPILALRASGLPQFEGLRQLTYSDSEDRSYQVDDPTGTVFVTEGAVPLLAVVPGSHTQPAMIARVSLPSNRDPLGIGFMQDRHQDVAFPEAKVQIRMLPPPPPGFTGLVGDFTLTSECDGSNATVGASIPWRVALKGDGDLAGFTLPRPPDTPAVRFYDANSKVEGDLDGGRWTATATFERSIVPTQPGRVVVPPLDLVVFAPSQGSYVHLTAEVAPFDVARGREAGGGLQSFSPTAGEPAPEDAAGPTVRPPIGWGRDHAPALGPLIPVGTAVAAAPGVGVGVLVAAEALAAARRRRREAARRDPTAAEILARLPADPAERLAALDGALRAALAARAGVRVAALDRDAAVRALPDDVRRQVNDATRLLDRARYADAGATADPLPTVREAIDALGRKA